MTITRKQIQAVLTEKFVRRPNRSYYTKTSDGRLVRFVDWRK